MNPSLDASYERCRVLNREHGRTYYLATRLLPRWKRRHVHALYGFMRHTDDIVDVAGHDAPAREARLRDWTGAFLTALSGGKVDDPVLPAVLHTIAVFDLARADFVAFLRSMEMDLTITSYPTYDDLLDYMAGSAAAIGTLMLPILGATDLRAAREPARQLGLAFQLTNFIRDVREDTALDRVYLPAEERARFGVGEEDLRRRSTSPELKALLALEVRRARSMFAEAEPALAAAPGSVRSGMRLAVAVYQRVLDRVERIDFDVLGRATGVRPWQLPGAVIGALRG